MKSNPRNLIPIIFYPFFTFQMFDQNTWKYFI